MIAWVYGSGFPKSLNIGKAVDKLQGNEREVLTKQQRKGRSAGILGKETEIVHVHDKGSSPYEGWGTALKPALEPITVARKPLGEKTVAENCLKWGVGGINIDGCRVEGQPPKVTGKGIRSKSWREKEDRLDIETETKNWEQPTGRFPANLIHDNSEEVRECFPETKSGGTNGKKVGNKNCWLGVDKEYDMNELAPNSGNASRFFKSIIYQAKASKRERNIGCEGLEEHQIVTFATANGTSNKPSSISEGRNTIYKNNHPTVKPIALMEYLVKLVSKEGHTVLDPFMGSGSTGIACKKLGKKFIGIEMESDYCKIAEARINAFKKEPEQLMI
jgi:site-specific DNA-methyltransferase (adenine-specific)